MIRVDDGSCMTLLWAFDLVFNLSRTLVEEKGQDQREAESIAGASSKLHQGNNMHTSSICCLLFRLTHLRINGFLFQTDKVSMLDEAIDYLKSLQLQLQVTEWHHISYAQL